MKYSPLIRKLLNISVDAKYQRVDVAERLKERCTDDADLIRQMLMNAVCDPRFKMHVAGYASWRSRAERCLENFAEDLMAIPNLTESDAFFRMDEMLDNWMQLCMDVVRAYDDERLKFDKVKDVNSNAIKKIRQALEDLLNGEGIEEGFHPVLEKDDEADLVLSWKLTKPKKDEGKEKTDSREEKEDENPDEHTESDANNDDMEEKAYNDNPEGFMGHSLERQKVLEDRFLTNVPPSLIRLAKLIGRSGDGIMSSAGSFSTATKSDIGGITVGNDLSSLLPTELALLSEPATQSVFYKNYATRRLQVFASTSHDTKGKKHRDGPVIICMDTSGSMKGEPVLVAKALTMAICIIAQRNHRPVLVVRYSEGHELFRLHNIGEQKKDVLEFLSVVGMGGNNEDELFRWLFTDIMPNERDYDAADVLCISDFGWTPVREESMELIENEKRKGMVFYGLNIAKDRHVYLCDYDSQPAKIISGRPESVCDSLWEYRNGEVVYSGKL